MTTASRNIHFQSTGTGSVLDLSSLTTLTNDQTTLELNLSDGGSILAPSLQSMTGVTARVYDGLTFDLSSATSYSGVSQLTEIKAYGAGSLLDLSGLPSLAGGESATVGLRVAVTAQAGGKVDLSNVTTASRNIHFQSTGAGSVLDLSSLTHTH